MGVGRSDWIVVGVDIGMEHYGDNEYFFDKYDSKSKLGDMTFLIDGMSGKYFIVGEFLLSANENGGFGLNEFPLIETNEFKESAKRVEEFIKLNFRIDKKIKPKLIVLTHWT